MQLQTPFGQSNQTNHGTDVPVSVQSDSGKLIVHNSKITIWFQGYKPVLHIFERNASGNSTGFTVAVDGVYELNSTNAPVAVLPMTSAFPQVESSGNGFFNYSRGVSVTYNNTSKMLNITFSLTSNELKVLPFYASQDNAVPNDMMQMSNMIAGQASVAVVFHVNATTAHVKFDLLVNHWTWVNTTSDRLALSALVMGHQTVRDSSGQDPTDQGTQVNDGNSNNNNQAGDNVASSSVSSGSTNMQQHEDRINILGANFLSLGYVSWGSEANATYQNHTKTKVSVSVMMFSHGMMEQEYNFTSILFIFNTPAGWQTNYTSLAYDPTIGLTTSSGSAFTSDIISYGAVAGVIAAMAAIGAVFAIRRRK
jgi:hypothetical protein